MHERGWSTLEIKSIDREQRTFEGIASSPTPDRGGDSLDPAGAQFTLPLAFLWFHDPENPIGEVFAADVRPDGIHVKGRVSRVTVPGRLKTLTDEAWSAFTANPPLVRGLSVGWKPLEQKMTGTIRRVSRWIWAELSAVTIPMNTDATILSVKSFDRIAPAASGTGARAVPFPGATGLSRVTSMNISEQLTAAQAELDVKSARFEALLNAEQTNGGLDDEETTERDTLAKDIATLTTKRNNFQTLEAAITTQSGGLKPVTPTRTMPRIEVKDHAAELPKGTLFTRYAMAVAAGKGSFSDTVAYAKRWDAQTPQVSAYVKSQWGQKAVEGTSVVASPGWGGELVNPSTIQTEFVELLRPQTIIGRVPGFRMTPFNVPIITQTGGSTFEWVGEGGVKPVGEMAFSRTTLPYHKVAGIIVMTEELVRLSTPDAEATARRDLIDQCAKFLDEQFIQVAITAGADNPASITNGVASPSASGTTLAALMADLNTALATISASGVSLSGLAIVTTSEVALRLSLMVTSLGTTPNGFNMSPSGGTILGYPVIVSDSVDADTLVIFKPSEIFLAEDPAVRLDSSNQATLDMSGGSSPVFSLWQRNCVGIRAERWITWQKRQPTVVAIIDTIAYVPGT